MSELMALNGANEVLTMSSREIAELTGKRHDHVLRTIDNLVSKGLDGATESSFHGYQNQLQREFIVNKRSSIYEIITKSNNVKFSACVREKAALTTIEQLQGVKLIRQYPVLGKYRIDGYDPVNNIAYEIDEEQHFTPQHMEADRIREKEIKAALGCEFVRIRV